MNAGVCSGLLLVAAGALICSQALGHGSVLQWLTGGALVGGGAWVVGRWWGR